MKQYTVNTILSLALHQFGPKTYEKLVGEFLHRLEQEVETNPDRVDGVAVTLLTSAARRQLEAPAPMEAYGSGSGTALPPVVQS